MEDESVYTFIYKTVREYYQYEDFLEKKLQENSHSHKLNEGYLIDKNYIDYWKRFTNYDVIKNKIKYRDYQDAKPIIYQYRRLNNLKKYQPDAIQYVFYTPYDLTNSLNQGRSYALIHQNFWLLICTQKGLSEKGGMNYIIGKNNIIFDFNKFGNCHIITYDNIIDNSYQIIQGGNNGNNSYRRIIYNNNNNNNNYNDDNDQYRNSYNNNNNNNFNNNSFNNNSVNPNNFNNDNFNNNYNDNGEELELRKILLLYAFEQEIKRKINNLQYKEDDFQTYYLISKEWIEQYKSCYRYDEICRMIQKKEDLKKFLNNGYDEAKRNMHLILKKISFNNNNAKINFPVSLKNNNTFLSERNEVKLSNQNIVSYWKNFEILNEDLTNLLSKSESHQYNFLGNSSDAKCLFCSGKVIIDLSNDEHNANNYLYEIGSINNTDMIYYDEFIFFYEDEESKNDNLSKFKNDYLKFQKENLNFGINLECELYSQNGYAYGIAYKIPPHE